MKKLLQTGSQSATAFRGFTGWMATDGTPIETAAYLAAHCEQLRRERPVSIADQARRLAVGIARSMDGYQPMERAAEQMRSTEDGTVLSLMTGGFDPSGISSVGIEPCPIPRARAICCGGAAGARAQHRMAGRTPAALDKLQAMLSASDDPGVRAVMAIVRLKPGASVPTVAGRAHVLRCCRECRDRPCARS